MLNACVRSRSDHTPCGLLLYLRCYLALRDISSSKQEVAEHVIRHPNVMRQNCRPKTKLGTHYAQVLDGFLLNGARRNGMKRFAWGIALMVLGVLALIGSNEVNDAAGGGFMMLIGGGVLTYYGNQYLKRVKQASAFALEMIREEGKIDASQIAQRIGVSEVDIRMYLAESQRKGVIPFKAEIV